MSGKIWCKDLTCSALLHGCFLMLFQSEITNTPSKRNSLQPKFRDTELRYSTEHKVVQASSKGVSQSVDEEAEM